MKRIKKGAHACQTEIFSIATRGTLQTGRTEALCCDQAGQCSREAAAEGADPEQARGKWQGRGWQGS